jgi:hypothetical protein
MKKLEELIYARVAAYSRQTGKRYVVLQRGAWAERIGSPFFRRNSVQFTGRLVRGSTPSLNDGEIVNIGFFHPIFSGYASTYAVVEVVHNPAKAEFGEDNPYIAKGKGILTMAASAVCLDDPKISDPCNSVPCTKFRIGVGAGAPLGSEQSFAFYDRLTMTHAIGRNEIPARLSLRGYTGGRTIPDFTKGSVLFNWSPGVSAFDMTFQLCGNAPGGYTNRFPDWDCCAMIDRWKEQYGDRWWEIVLDPNGPVPILNPITEPCAWIYFFPWDQADG